MNKPVIKVENLTKEFIISHESGERYMALRDVIAKKAKSAVSFSKTVTSDIKKTVEQFKALEEVNFEINAGERVGIIGRNGAGKSTLLKILSRITEPSKGKISIRGRVASLLEVGTGFHPELTGRENIFLNGAILGMSRNEIKSKFDEIVDFAEIEKFLDTPVKRYSSGMYVRLAFAVAAHLEPEILIVDEVLAVGDAQFQKKCLGKMEDVSRNQGRTVLFVSHSMGVIASFCQRGILLNKGRIIQDGDVRSVIDEYLLFEKGKDNAYRAKPEMDRKATNYILSVDTLNSNDLNCEVFQFDEQIVLKLVLQINSYDPGAKISITVQNFNGDFVTTIVEDISQLSSFQHAGTIAVKIKFARSILAPNSYAFRVALFHHNVVVYDLQEMICPFRIVDTGSKLSLFEGYNYGSFFIDYSLERSE